MTLPILAVSLSDQFQIASHHHTHCTCDLEEQTTDPSLRKMMRFIDGRMGPPQHAWMQTAIDALQHRPDLLCTWPIVGDFERFTFDYHGARRVKPFQHVTSIF